MSQRRRGGQTSPPPKPDAPPITVAQGMVTLSVQDLIGFVLESHGARDSDEIGTPAQVMGFVQDDFAKWQADANHRRSKWLRWLHTGKWEEGDTK